MLPPSPPLRSPSRALPEILDSSPWPSILFSAPGHRERGVQAEKIGRCAEEEAGKPDEHSEGKTAEDADGDQLVGDTAEAEPYLALKSAALEDTLL